MVLTTLWKRSMPLIRYKIGDRAAFGEKCRCGRGTHTLKSIEGRIDDLIVLPSGKVRSSFSIDEFGDMACLKEYQIIQEKENLFLFRHVPRGVPLSGSAKSSISQRIRDGCLGEDVRIEFEEVDTIPRGRTGKLRSVMSKVRPGVGW